MTQPIPPDFVAPEIHAAVPPHDSALDSTLGPGLDLAPSGALPAPATALPATAALATPVPAPAALATPVPVPHASLAVAG